MSELFEFYEPNMLEINREKRRGVFLKIENGQIPEEEAQKALDECAIEALQSVNKQQVAYYCRTKRSPYPIVKRKEKKHPTHKTDILQQHFSTIDTMLLQNKSSKEIYNFLDLQSKFTYVTFCLWLKRRKIDS